LRCANARRYAERVSARAGHTAATTRAVDPQSLRLSRFEADLDSVGALVGDRIEHHPRRGGAAAHELALVGGAGRPPGAGEVHTLEQVRLPGSVRADHDGQAVAERHLRLLEVAEVAQLEARGAHSAL
jgi:hypothetical protein